MRRWSISCWMRVSRTLTMANSAATKKAFAATRRTTRMILKRTRVTMAFNHILTVPWSRKDEGRSALGAVRAQKSGSKDCGDWRSGNRNGKTIQEPQSLKKWMNLRIDDQVDWREVTGGNLRSQGPQGWEICFLLPRFPV